MQRCPVSLTSNLAWITLIGLLQHSTLHLYQD